MSFQTPITPARHFFGPEGPHAQRILVVDDNDSERFRLALLMERSGHTTFSARDAAEALELAKRHKPGIVISDWYMPGMNGLELCKALRETEHGRDAYFILVTSKDRHLHVSKGLDEGADDFIAKPFQALEINARVTAGKRSFLRKKALEKSNEKLREEAASYHEAEIRIKDSLAGAARLLVRRLHPQNSVHGQIKVGHIARTLEGLSGDVFGFIPLENTGKLGFFAVDVSGHGISAALTAFSVTRMLTSRSSRRTLLTNGEKPTSPEQVVLALNDHFQCDQNCDEYFTMVYGFIDHTTGEGQLCQAGHPHPLIVRASGKIEAMGDGGLPVGLVDIVRYENISFKLETGDRLLIHSDGITEARNSDGEQWGVNALSHKADRHFHLPLQSWLDQIYDCVMNWMGSSALEDDLSMIALERLPLMPDGPSNFQ